jgi:hypothetical protein
LRDRGDDRHVRDASVRARGKVRRYAVANGLSVFVTLTFAVAVDRVVARVLVKKFLGRLRHRYFGDLFPWVFVVEGNGSDARVHVHALLPKVSGAALRDAWPCGCTDVADLRSRTEVRKAAHYIAKDFDKVREPRSHRYEVAQGFAPEAIRSHTDSPEDGESAVIDWMGRQPDEVRRPEDGPCNAVRHLWWRDP